jgi:glycosyltransferase involved in cell wall biosynthesis
MRVLVVGGPSFARRTGSTRWLHHEVQQIPYQLPEMVQFTSGYDIATVEPRKILEFAAAVKNFDVVLCEVPEAMLLVLAWRRFGLKPWPVVALEVDAQRRARRLREHLRAIGEHDPWPDMRVAPWLVWLAATDAQRDVLVAERVAPERIRRINGSTAAFSLFDPGVDRLLDGGPEVDGATAEGLPSGRVIVAGTGRRDPVTCARAAALVRDIPMTFVTRQVESFQKRLRAEGLDPPALMEWMDELPLERFIALLKRNRVLVVPLEAGQGDGGHTTVALAHRVGLPVVCSAIPGVIDYVRDEHDALLPAPGDAGALARAIERLWSDGELRARLAANGKRTEQGRTREMVPRLADALDEARAGLESFAGWPPPGANR